MVINKIADSKKILLMSVGITGNLNLKTITEAK